MICTIIGPERNPFNLFHIVYTFFYHFLICPSCPCLGFMLLLFIYAIHRKHRYVTFIIFLTFKGYSTVLQKDIALLCFVMWYIPLTTDVVTTPFITVSGLPMLDKPQMNILPWIGWTSNIYLIRGGRMPGDAVLWVQSSELKCLCERYSCGQCSY